MWNMYYTYLTACPVEWLYVSHQRNMYIPPNVVYRYVSHQWNMYIPPNVLRICIPPDPLWNIILYISPNVDLVCGAYDVWQFCWLCSNSGICWTLRRNKESSLWRRSLGWLHHWGLRSANTLLYASKLVYDIQLYYCTLWQLEHSVEKSASCFLSSGGNR